MNYLINNPFRNFYINIQYYNNKHLFINNINKNISNFINNSIYYFKYYSNIIILFAKNNILFIFNK